MLKKEKAKISEAIRRTSSSLKDATENGSVVLLVSCLMLSLAPALTYSGEQWQLESPTSRVSVWSNAWTETFYGNGTPPFKTVVHSRPKMVWNGTEWVKYEIKPISEMEVTLKTPTCAYLVNGSEVLLFRPDDIKSSMARMEWIIEKYSITLQDWVQEELSEVTVGYNETHVWQTWVLTDGSIRTLYIDCENKQTIVFTAAGSATYKMSWHFSDIPASKAVLSNGLFLELKEGRMDEYFSLNFSKLALCDQNSLSVLIDYGDVRKAFYQDCAIGRSESGFAYASLTYGNWSLGADESVVLDPTTETFVSEAALDGKMTKYGDSYPPNAGISVDTQGNIVVGQEYISGWYNIYRGYVSFNTSSIQDTATITDAVLKLKTYGDASVVDFTMRVMGGSQPIYGAELEENDWNCGTQEVATWPSSSYPGAGLYVNITILTAQINKTGRTQFELKSDREGYAPQPMQVEYVSFYSADSAGNEPKLEVTWMPHVTYKGGQWWYYWNSTSNRLAIVLFGGYYYPGFLQYGVGIYSLYQQYTWDKEFFVLQLYEHGFDVMSNLYTVNYSTTSTWIYDAAMSVADQYDYIHLFGFSAGGVAVAYEIQKANASIYSSAVVASAPVNLGYGIFNSAQTANQTKVCVSFIAPTEDIYYENMSVYFNNANVHKEWHKWEDGHDPFPYYCLNHSGENVSEAVISWYERHSVILKNPSFEDRLRTVWGSAHWQTNNQGWRELKGDIDGDGKSGLKDYYLFSRSYGSYVGNRSYDWRCDFNGDGKVDPYDNYIFNRDYGKTAIKYEGAYSWYTAGGGEYRMWQWLNSSIELIKGKQINFSFSFRPEYIYVNETEIQARAEICYINSTGEHWVNGTWFHPTSITWYSLSVIANIPDDTTAIKVVIHGKPDFKAWIDLASLDITEM